MSRRTVGLLVAAVLALVGTVILVGYVSSAERRALAGEELVEVYVVTAPVASGTPAEVLAGSIGVEQVPAKVRAQGAVTDLQSLAGLVAVVDLVPGEQLVAARFGEPQAQTGRGLGVELPEGMLEVTIETDAQRAVGGLLQPGQTVSVFASFSIGGSPGADGRADPTAGAVQEAGGSVPSDDSGQSTSILLRKALVTAVQEPSGPVDPEQRNTTSPDGSLLVTLAVDPFDAERLVFTAEFGTIWLAIERESVPEVELPGQSRDSVLADQGVTP